MDNQTLPAARLTRRFLGGRRPLEFALRGLVAAALLAIILWRLDIGKALAIIASANLRWLLASLALALMVRVLPAFAWRTLISAQDIEVPIWRLILFQYVGLFFNSFTPSNIGSDVARAYLLSRWTGQAVDALVSIVVLKFLTLFNLLLLAAIATPYARSLVGGSAIPGLSLGLAFFVLALFLVASLVVGRKSPSQRWGGSQPVGRWLRRGLDSIASFRNSPGALLRAYLWVLLSQVVTIGVPYLIGLALSLPVEPVHFLVFIPIIYLAAMLPISAGGLGVREGAFVVLFTRVGLSPEAAFSLSVLRLVIATLANLPGGLYLLGTAGVRRQSQG